MKSARLIYLASGSPRRRELLRQIGVPFRVIGADLDETALQGESSLAYVSRLAQAKANAGWERGLESGGAPVLAADTAVVLDGRILGKPADMNDAMAMLLKLSGRTHEVMSAVALRTVQGIESKISRSTVTFRSIDRSEARAYWETGEASDKAGAYAIQGYAAIFISDLQGSYSGVMGLPLFETAALLEAAGVTCWHRDEH
ncbi:MAG TPA: Maf family protein [Steroidobacteraceae bacterium]